MNHNLNILYLLIFSLIFISPFINCQEESFNLEVKYPIAFTLLNQNIIIYSSKGFYTFNSDLSSLIYSYNFTNELIFDEYNSIDIYYPSISQYLDDEGGNILIFVFQNIYLFNNNGKFISENSLNNIIYSNEITYIIVPFKYLDNDCYYALVYIYNQKINFLYSKINKENGNNEILINTYYENNDREISHLGLSCKRMKKNNKYYIICLYSYFSNSKPLLAVEIFDFNNNFAFLERKEYEANSLAAYIKSIVNNEESKIYICYLAGGYSYCIYFDIITNQFSKRIETGNSCKINNFSFNFNFFKNTGEFIFSCNDNFHTFIFSKFDENMNFINQQEQLTRTISDGRLLFNKFIFNCLYNAQK